MPHGWAGGAASSNAGRGKQYPGYTVQVEQEAALQYKRGLPASGWQKLLLPAQVLGQCSRNCCSQGVPSDTLHITPAVARQRAQLHQPHLPLKVRWKSP